MNQIITHSDNPEARCYRNINRSLPLPYCTKGTRQLYASIITLLICFGTAASQRTDSRPTTASDFNIEIINLDSRKHVFSIPDPPRNGGYLAHVDLKRIPEWKISEEAPEVTNALRLRFWLEAGMPQIEVLANLGRVETRPYEWDKQKATKIVTRALPIDETITITETAAFGIVPFQVKVFRAQPWSVGPPQVTNKTQALTVLTLTESRPVYILSVRNVSHKAISAIRWYGLENGQKQGGNGTSGAPLIAAGRPFEIRQRFALAEEKIQSQPADQPATGETVPTSREIVIAAIVFSDGTFEGEPNEAAEMAAQTSGERIQLSRVLRLLEKMSGTAETEYAARLQKLKTDIGALSEEVDARLANELIAQFADASEDIRNRRIKEEIANGLRFVKNDVIHEIEKFERQREDSPAKANFESWLKELISMLGKMIPN